MPIDQHTKIRALAAAAGWEIPPERDGEVMQEPLGGEIRVPLEFHDDAFALQQKLCQDLAFRRRFILNLHNTLDHQYQPCPWDEVWWRILSLSPSGRVDALYAALPDCNECDGDEYTSFDVKSGLIISLGPCGQSLTCL